MFLFVFLRLWAWRVGAQGWETRGVDSRRSAKGSALRLWASDSGLSLGGKGMGRKAEFGRAVTSVVSNCVPCFIGCC